jgi:hypothetical protein
MLNEAVPWDRGWMGHVGFVVERANGPKLPNRLQPKPSDFVMLQ